eukprot:COSAG01_NODE_7098_length_3354_cov_88.432873_2_plen_165_part_00
MPWLLIAAYRVNRYAPAAVVEAAGREFSNSTVISMVAAGATFTLLLDNTGAVFSAGGNGHGQLGRGQLGPGGTRFERITTGGLHGHKIVHVAAGVAHSMFLSDDGRIFAVGDDTYGQLADARGPSTTPLTQPVEVCIPRIRAWRYTDRSVRSVHPQRMRCCHSS